MPLRVSEFLHFKQPLGPRRRIEKQFSSCAALQVQVESIFLSVEGGDFEAFPVSLSLLPNTAGHLLALSGVPRAAGTVSCYFFLVLGCRQEHLSL